ncbi:MAG: hypothetical protein KGI38_10340 [Thaumarchaeota archaeon]|nr:hypothetical protein [Nitrososphaerota archaeon]
MSGAPYLASDDSALLRRALERYSGERCLEIGAGNGGNLVDLSGRFRLVVGTDLVKPSMDDWKGEANFVLADLASSTRGSAFDLVAFNPPYVAAGPVGDAAVEGGPGLEVPKAFLEEALRVVRKDGVVVFLLSDAAKPDEFERICARHGFGLQRIGSQRLFFEELSVYEAVKAQSSR